MNGEQFFTKKCFAIFFNVTKISSLLKDLVILCVKHFFTQPVDMMNIKIRQILHKFNSFHVGGKLKWNSKFCKNVANFSKLKNFKF